MDGEDCGISCSLLVFYLLYSFIVYTKGTEDLIRIPAEEQVRIKHGKSLFSSNIIVQPVTSYTVWVVTWARNSRQPTVIRNAVKDA